MCQKQFTIEDRDQFICALAEKYPSVKDTLNIEDVFYTATEIIDDNVLATRTAGVFHYGIISVGDSTVAAVTMVGNSTITIAAQNQIIEWFEALSINSGTNVFFRGWTIKCDSLELFQAAIS